MQAHLYRIKLKHDKGTHYIKTVASCEESARAIVKKHECCPDGAILNVKKLKTIYEGSNNT